MTATYVGSLALSAALPGASAAALAGSTSIASAFPDVAGRLAALQAQVLALATLPPLPSFEDMAARAVELQVSIALAMATPGLPPPPSLATAIAALAALVADLTSLTATLNVSAGLIADFRTALAAAGVHVVAYDGDLSTLGSQLQAAVNAHTAGTGHANALALVTTDADTWGAMQLVFKVSP